MDFDSVPTSPVEVALPPLGDAARPIVDSSQTSLSSLTSLLEPPSLNANIPNALNDTKHSLSLIPRAFAPHVAVVASADLEELVQAKGYSTFLELVRPFGDRISGNVTIRDSHAMSVLVDDFSIRFVDFHHYIEAGQSQKMNPPHVETYRPGGDLTAIEKLMDRRAAEMNSLLDSSLSNGNGVVEDRKSAPLNLLGYNFFLQRLLSSFPVSAHETFSHPVACVLAISSRALEPIDSLLAMYNTTNQAAIPWFMDAGFLRYYVLIHDDDRDDIIRSYSTLERMKRSLGLHCSILRLSSSSDYSEMEMNFPQVTEWISAAEELAFVGINSKSTHNLTRSETQGLQLFTRELVTQSIVPQMERCIVTWNEQIASYRRGLAGRFLNVSRRYFGNNSSRSATPMSGSGNYDPSTSSYPPSTPEAQMRKLADYAFMLRDWRLAHSTYDLLRKDFGNDKAWKYAAGAQEMTAISLLLLPNQLTTKVRIDTLDPMLDSACYSYTARCSSPYFALRCLLVAVELLCLKGTAASDNAAKWAMTGLRMGVLGDSGTGLLMERISGCYKLTDGQSGTGLSKRRRKAALWQILACENWLETGYRRLAEVCLNDAEKVYRDCDGWNGISERLKSLDERVNEHANADGARNEGLIGNGVDSMTVEFA